jgi:AraC-like DNA-binding protein/mannose-6-phosphate isomerase-like protein (cupin superfamily)
MTARQKTDTETFTPERSTSMDSPEKALQDNRLRNHINVDKRRRTEQHKQPIQHFHPYFELYYMLSGSCQFFIHNTVHNLESGDFLLIPPGDYHNNTYYRRGTHDRFIIYFDLTRIDQSLMPYLPFSLDSSKVMAQQFSVKRDSRDYLHGLLDRMLDSYQEGTPYGDLLLEYLFPELLLFLNRNTEPVLKNRSITPTESSLENAAHYISEHYENDITLEDAAGIAGLTPTYFSRKFKELTGIGFREYLTHIRLKQGAQLLRSTALSVLQISQECGFSSSNYFGDAFRAVYGVSPREYRKKETA